jgi:glycine betaine/proline transport system substrate-binding protein
LFADLNEMEEEKFMKKNKKLIISVITMIAVVGLLLSSCSGKESKALLKMADPGWDSVRFHNHVAGFILEKG